MNEVSIKGQGLQLKDEEDIQPLINLIKDNPNFEILTLSGNSLAPRAGKELAKTLKSEKCTNLKYLNFSDLFTGRVRAEIPPTLTYIFDALLELKCKLIKIDLSDNAFGPDGAKPCVQLLKSHCCLNSLKELLFNNNGLGLGGVIIAQALEQANKLANFKFPLRLFIAGRNRLENPGAKALGQAFHKMTNLEHIEIPQNGIYSEGIIALANGLSNCKNLKIVNLNDNCFRSKGGIHMAKAMGNWENLEVLDFGDTLIRNGGCNAFGNQFREKEFSKLVKVNFSHCEIKLKYAIELVKILNGKYPHIDLNIGGNAIGQTAIDSILSYVKLNFEYDSDEGTPENSENSEEEDDDYQSDDDTTLADLKISESNQDFVKEVVEDCTIEQFLDAPSGSRLLGIGDDVVDELLKIVKVCSYKSYVDLYLILAGCLVDSSHSRTMDILSKGADELFKLAFNNTGTENTFVINYLLTKIGLLKCEEKCIPIIELRGILLSLQHVVNQKYFPKNSILALKTILDKPPCGSDNLKQYHNDKAQLAGVLYRII